MDTFCGCSVQVRDGTSRTSYSRALGEQHGGHDFRPVTYISTGSVLELKVFRRSQGRRFEQPWVAVYSQGKALLVILDIFRVKCTVICEGDISVLLSVLVTRPMCKSHLVSFVCCYCEIS